MGSLAKTSQYWIKKQSEGSQSGSKNIVSSNFAFSLSAFLFLSFRFRDVSFSHFQHQLLAARLFWLFLKPARVHYDKGQAIRTYFSMQVLLFRLVLFAFLARLVTCVYTSGFVLDLLANGRKERKKGGKTQRFLFFQLTTNRGFKTYFCVSTTPKTTEWCRMVCFVRRVEGEARP